MMFTQWEYTAIADGSVSVMPDGCLDVLIVESTFWLAKDNMCNRLNAGSSNGNRSIDNSGIQAAFIDSILADTKAHASGRSILLTDWDYRARRVDQIEGQKTIGFRLRPGITLDPRKLEGVELKVENIGQLILEEVDASLEMCEVIEELCVAGVSMQQAAGQSGVSVRTLQRHFNAQGLPPPDYWRRLSRARNAAAALARDMPIIDIAGDYRFSDQAHMTREFVQWFAITPSRLRRDPDLLNDICQPGLGNWTAEQISIR